MSVACCVCVGGGGGVFLTKYFNLIQYNLASVYFNFIAMFGSQTL